MKFPFIISAPPDGFEQFEKVFLREVVISLYKVLPTDKDRFILMACLEMGYPEEAVGKMVGMSQVVISNRLKKIRQHLKCKKYDQHV